MNSSKIIIGFVSPSLLILPSLFEDKKFLNCSKFLLKIILSIDFSRIILTNLYGIKLFKIFSVFIFSKILFFIKSKFKSSISDRHLITDIKEENFIYIFSFSSLLVSIFFILIFSLLLDLLLQKCPYHYYICVLKVWNILYFHRK